MPVVARAMLGLAGLHFFQAEAPSKEKHRSGGVGRTKFSEEGGGQKEFDHQNSIAVQAQS